MRRRTAPILLALVAAGSLRLQPAQAQLVLPGAEPPAPAGTTVRPPPVPRPRAPRSGELAPLSHVPINAPSVTTIIGKPLHLNGASSEIVLEAKNGLISQVARSPADKDLPADPPLVVTRLILTGELLSKPNEACRIEVKPVPVIDTQPMGRPLGVMRYRVSVATCPLTFDVLDGSILPTKDTQSCAFKSADCQVNIGGLWGPKAADIGPQQIKDLERARAQADLTARETFHDLLKRTKEKADVKRVAAEQAAFSSLREETCRTYEGESVHHFCATRLTQARVTALQAELEAAPPPDPKKERKKKRRE